MWNRETTWIPSAGTAFRVEDPKRLLRWSWQTKTWNRQAIGHEYRTRYQVTSPKKSGREAWRHTPNSFPCRRLEKSRSNKDPSCLQLVSRLSCAMQLLEVCFPLRKRWRSWCSKPIILITGELKAVCLPPWGRLSSTRSGRQWVLQNHFSNLESCHW